MIMLLRAFAPLQAKLAQCGAVLSNTIYLRKIVGKIIDCSIYDRLTNNSVNLKALLTRFKVKANKASNAKQRRAWDKQASRFSGSVMERNGVLYSVEGGNALFAPRDVMLGAYKEPTHFSDDSSLDDELFANDTLDSQDWPAM